MRRNFAIVLAGKAPPRWASTATRADAAALFVARRVFAGAAGAGAAVFRARVAFAGAAAVARAAGAAFLAVFAGAAAFVAAFSVFAAPRLVALACASDFLAALVLALPLASWAVVRAFARRDLEAG